MIDYFLYFIQVNPLSCDGSIIFCIALFSVSEPSDCTLVACNSERVTVEAYIVCVDYPPKWRTYSIVWNDPDLLCATVVTQGWNRY